MPVAPGFDAHVRRPIRRDWSVESDGTVNIGVMNADGSHQTQLTYSQGSDAGSSWSPDGARLAFQSNRDGGIDEVFVMNNL
jgi:TolB protein